MRRPLLCGCICLFVLLALWTKLMHPLPRTVSDTVGEGDYVILTGQVYQKEYRISYGEEKIRFYLKSITFSDQSKLSENQRNNTLKNIICDVPAEVCKEWGRIPPLGCQIMAEGVLQAFSHATNDGEFDAANYYTIEGIGATLKEVRILKTDTKRWPIREGLYQLRQYLLGNLYRAFPEKEASILAKMLLGDGSGLDREIRDLYQANGIVHILSISGLHITLLGMGFYQLLRRLTMPIVPAAILGGIVILLYGIMTGFGVSACRAIGMYLIRMLGEVWGKSYDMLTAMGVLAVTMLTENPLLSYHSGFLLSFASVCGIGLLGPILQLPAGMFRKRAGHPGWMVLMKKALEGGVSGISVSLSVTLFTIPIQFFFFYQIPVYSVFLNLLVIPFMSVVMIVGLLGMVFPVLGFLSPIEVGIFSWFEWLCKLFEKLPGHTLLLGRPDMWRVLLYYLFLLVPVFGWKKGQKKVFLGCTVVALMLLLIPLPGRTRIYCLDVGQGECIVLQTKGGGNYLFDGGSNSRSDVGEKVIVPFLQYHGMGKLDGVFLSHVDTDHVNGVLQMLQGGDVMVKTLYIPSGQEGAFSEKLKSMETGERIELQTVQKGNVWTHQDFTLKCLHPAKDFQGESNDGSACYLLQAGDFRMLLTGDVEEAGEERLLEGLKGQNISGVDVLKVAHHGSSSSTSGEFLERIQPKLAIISCGRKNSYGHPHTETLERLKQAGCRIMTTPEYGQITIDTEEKIAWGY